MGKGNHARRVKRIQRYVCIRHVRGRLSCTKSYANSYVTFKEYNETLQMPSLFCHYHCLLPYVLFFEFQSNNQTVLQPISVRSESTLSGLRGRGGGGGWSLKLSMGLASSAVNLSSENSGRGTSRNWLGVPLNTGCGRPIMLLLSQSSTLSIVLLESLAECSL